MSGRHGDTHRPTPPQRHTIRALVAERRAGARRSWSVGSWLESLPWHEEVERALQVPEDNKDPLEFARGLGGDRLKELLVGAGLSGLYPRLEQAVKELQVPCSTAAELNAKFQFEASFDLTFGNLDDFYGGLTKLVGPVREIEGSILQAMEHEHCNEKDCYEQFKTSNGVTTYSEQEWEFVTKPVDGKEYPDRFERGDGRRRKTRKRADLVELMGKKNEELSKEGFSKLVEEEVVAAALHTGPMYEKYNAVLRAKTGAVLLRQKFDELCEGNLYISTLHAINSFIVKMSKLTQACVLWRGSTRARLPDSFTDENKWKLRGGIEFGFTSMTRDCDQALHYAEGAAATVFKARQGLVDRGAEVQWISQYPHEQEILFPPLLGLEMTGTSVEKGRLLVELRLSLNLTAETLDQIKAKRQSLMKDTGANMVLEIKAAAKDPRAPGPFAALMQAASESGPLKHPADWYSDNNNFQSCLQELVAIKNDVEAMVGKTDAELLQAITEFVGTEKRPSCREQTFALDLGDHLKNVSELPEESAIFDLPHIHTLDLRGHDYLLALPESLGQLRELRTLNLSLCSHLQALPESLGQLRELRTLNLSLCCTLQALPESLGQLRELRTLGLRGCSELQALPESLGQLRELRTLNPRGCFALRALPESLGQLRELRTLGLYDCRASLPESLGQLPALQIDRTRKG